MNFDQDASYLAIGEHTNANGSKAFRQAMLEERWDDCVTSPVSRSAWARTCWNVCIDYVGRDGVADRKEIVSRCAQVRVVC